MGRLANSVDIFVHLLQLEHFLPQSVLSLSLKSIYSLRSPSLLLTCIQKLGDTEALTTSKGLLDCKLGVLKCTLNVQSSFVLFIQIGYSR